MNWSKIICIEVKKYNDSQLFVISEQLNIIDGYLKRLKDEGSVRVYWDVTKTYIIGSLKRKDLHNDYNKTLYKGLLLNSNYFSMTKKEKDKLLNIQPMEFNTKKNATKPIVIFSNSVENSQNNTDVIETVEVVETVEVLELDSILDKIYKFGINSLTKNEKEFLDNESKK